MNDHYTVHVYLPGDRQPITWPDIEAPSEDAAVGYVLLGFPQKRQIRSTAVLRHEKETGDA